VLNLTEDVWEHIIGTNLKSVWLGMRSVIPHMIAAGGGRIVNTSLMSAQRGSRATAAVKPRPLGSCPFPPLCSSVLFSVARWVAHVAFVIGRSVHGGRRAKAESSWCRLWHATEEWRGPTLVLIDKGDLQRFINL
jgi:NAD(P)-dependent dehydrogenase (short-subunit alcohol dehydrogenase family)